jgi:hypothetical protein
MSLQPLSVHSPCCCLLSFPQLTPTMTSYVFRMCSHLMDEIQRIYHGG